MTHLLGGISSIEVGTIQLGVEPGDLDEENEE